MFATLAGLFYTWTGIAGHNFFHLRDNYRMMYFNLLFMSYRDWRITHALSHHAYPNSLLDYEMVQYEPIFVWMPSISDKNWFQRYASWIYAPIIYVGVYHIEFVKKLVVCRIDINISTYAVSLSFSLSLLHLESLRRLLKKILFIGMIQFH